MTARPRIDLIEATESTLRAALEDRSRLEQLLDVTVPGDWPPEHYEAHVVQHCLETLRRGDQEPGFNLHFLIADEVSCLPRMLAGIAGYAGPPDADGTVEIGYGIVDSMRRRGLASAAVSALVQKARSHPRVRRVIANTLREMAGADRVLVRNGFQPTEPRPKRGMVRYALDLSPSRSA